MKMNLLKRNILKRNELRISSKRNVTQNKFILLMLTVALSLTLAACGKSVDNRNQESDIAQDTHNITDESTPQGDQWSSAPDTIMITTKNGSDEDIEVKVPYNPQRVAVLDLASLDILDYLGLGDKVVGTAKITSIDYLQSYNEQEGISNLGTIKEANLEAVMAAEPDVILIGGRLSSSYEVLSEIAPVITVSVDYEVGLIESVRNNTAMIASLFGMEQNLQDIFKSYETRVSALAEAAADHTAIIGMVTSSNLTTLGNASRCSLIGNEIGFVNLAADVDSTHGNESSFELVAKLNPEYIFVLDRDAAISTQGAQLAQEVMNNELVQKTAASEKDHIYYLTPTVWYTAEGGLTATDIMLQDLEAVLLSE